MKLIIKSIFLFILLLNFNQTVEAFEITSPFGWRTHPVHGGQRFHAGVDIALDYGDPVPATASGVVAYSGEATGYGNVVYVNHADGTQTRYAHLQELLVSNGQAVSKGQLVGLAGSTGWSTGPHLHFEYRIEGEPVDPYPYLIAQGWNVVYGSGGGGSFDMPGFGAFNEVPWDLEGFFEIGQLTKEILEEFSQICTNAITSLRSEAIWLLLTLMVIDLSLAVIFLDFRPTWENILSKIMRFCFILFLITNWSSFINDFVLSFSTSSASVFAGVSEGEIAENVSDPSLIMQKGVYLIKPVFNHVSQFTGLKLMSNLVEVFLALIMGLVCLFCFFFMGLSVTIIYLEFYIFALLSILTIPLTIITPLKHFGERGLGSVITSGIKLMTISVFITILVSFIRDFEPTKFEVLKYMKITFLCIAMAFLSIRIPRVVTNLIGGGVPRI